MPILEVIVLGETLTAEAIGQTLYAQTAAELAASVTPAAYRYPPGDIRRYGAASGGSATTNATAWQAACAQASQPGSLGAAPVYVPTASAGFEINAGATVVGAPIKIYGDNAYYSYIYSANDISLLTIQDVQQLQGVLIEDLGLIRGTTVGSTKALVHFKNSAYGRIVGCLIIKGFFGVRYEDTVTAPSSCYSCSIEDSTIAQCSSINIECEANTNHLTLRNVTFGSAPIALKQMDSGGLTIFGGDAEGGYIDIDASSDTRVGALICGADFEGSDSAVGTIRIGNTGLVRNVTIISNVFVNGGAAQYVINPVRCDQLTVIGNAVTTGTSSGFHINPSGTTQSNFLIANNTWQVAGFQIIKGTLGYQDTNVVAAGGTGFTGRHADALITITYSASMTPDAALGNWQSITISDGTAFTINDSTNPVTGQELTFWIINGAGGAHGAITWGAAYRMGGALAAIASSKNRSITFRYSGAAWYETYRSPADVAQ